MPARPARSAEIRTALASPAKVAGADRAPNFEQPVNVLATPARSDGLRYDHATRTIPDNTRRAVIELAKDWRTDRVLRRLEAMLAVADKTTSLIVSGAGDVIEPTDGVIGIGSGGPFALSAAKALLAHSNLSAKDIVEASLRIAGDVCIYTNTNIKVEVL